MRNHNCIKAPIDPFRDNTLYPKKKIFYLFRHGGIGDYICAMTAIRWIAKNHPWVKGSVVCVNWLSDLFRLMIADCPNWSVGSENLLPELNSGKYDVFALHKEQMPNAAGMHLVDNAFAQLANLNPAPTRDYVQIGNRLNKIKLSKNLRIEGKFAVLTPGATCEMRSLKASTFNSVKNFLLESGLQVVLLGHLTTGDRKIFYRSDYDFSGCINLIDQTTILEAAQLINRAELIAGLDNGLLHLAACTETSIVFAYNVASPEHRRPSRPSGQIFEIAPPNTLACRFCQSKVRFNDHLFSECLYKDNECLEYLTGEKFIEKISEILRGKNGENKETALRSDH